MEQTRFLSALAHQPLPFPRRAQQQVAEITRFDSGPGWWEGWVQRGQEITLFALNIARAGAGDAPKRVQLGRRSLERLGILPPPL